MLNELDFACSKVGLRMNLSKTKFMTNIVPNNHFTIQNKVVELVEKYMYLGQKIRISSDNHTCEIQRRITLAWAAFGKLRDTLRTNIPISLKREVFDQYVLAGHDLWGNCDSNQARLRLRN
ncbi:unnamed protein product [Diabrotica balteata]|uniref:Reverse transcriptase n=1 Tax=Diabrotica balteata TaxID=107213 RepID=A0A9N9T267_DIABA|nr:unnamed protein product [Diabrotica balteata]